MTPFNNLSPATQNLLATLPSNPAHWEEALAQAWGPLYQQHVAVARRMMGAIDTLIGQGFSTTVHTHLKHLDGLFEQQQNNDTRLEDGVRNSNKGLPSDVVRLVIDVERLCAQTTFFEQIQRYVSAVEVPADTFIKASEEYPLRAQRARLARRCLSSSRSEWGNCENFVEETDKMPMFAMFMGDALTHYELGLALLNGTPKTIQQASSMDTATRDALNERVWDFVCETLNDTAIFGPQAMAVHRTKLEDHNAHKQRRAIAQALNVPASPLSIKRKM